MSDPTDYQPEPEDRDAARREQRRVDEAMAVDSVDDSLSRHPDQNAGDVESRRTQPGEEEVPEEIRRLREHPPER